MAEPADPGPPLPRRERILAAALELAGREGLEALTTRSVAAEAGVNLGLLHYYFESKESLVEETIGAFIGELRDRLATLDPGPYGATAKDGPPSGAAGPEAGSSVVDEEALADFLSGTFDLVARRPALLFGLVSRMVAVIARGFSAPPPEAAAERARGKAGTELAGIPPFSSLVEIQGLFVGRVRPLLARRFGSDRELLARKSLQLLTAVFHPLLLSPVPLLLFGFDLGDAEKRRAYVRGVVADVFASSASDREGRDSTRQAT